MSRIEDDRDAARLAERVAQQRRAEETKKKEQAQADTAFSRLVQAQKTESQKGERQQTDSKNAARSAIAHALGQADEVTHAEGQALDAQAQAEQGLSRDTQARLKGRMGGRALEEKVKNSQRTDGAHGQEVKLAEDRGDAAVAGEKAVDQADHARGSEGRSADAKSGRDSADGKKSEKEGKAAAKGQGARAEKGDLKTDKDKGQGGQGGGKDDKGGNQNAMSAAGFRFNPALMAPVPVAKKNDVQGSDRLRRLAQEIAQKIVERVRVGTNALGHSEFQIDLKGDVLNGLKMKVSAKNGRISAVFQGSDKEVLKMLSEQGEALKNALGGRGLTLDQFKVEYTA